ncbi:MAG: ABC transporter permease [Anaerolineae bacterium]
MHKLISITWHTYRQNLLRPGFLFFAFGLPVLCLLLIGIVASFSLQIQPGEQAIGYVDHAAVLRDSSTWQTSSQMLTTISLRRFSDEDSAQAALASGSIQVYYVLPTDYLASGQAREVTHSPNALLTRAVFGQFVRSSLLDPLPTATRQRILAGTDIVHDTPVFTDPFAIERAGNLIIVSLYLFAFFLLSLFTRHYFSQALIEEHSNRTIEIILTSVRAEQLLAGKVLGLVLLGFTPLVIWGSIIGIVLALVLPLAQVLGITPMAFPFWGQLAIVMAILFPAFVLDATGTLLAGALSGALESSQEIFFFPALVETVVFFSLIMSALLAPDSPLAVILSLVPFTSPFVLPLRLGLTTVPFWQTGLALVLLWLTMFLGIFFSARFYRAWRLNSGEVPRLRLLFSVLLSK